MAKLHFRYGTMNCGKSVALMQVAHNYEENNKNVYVLKSDIDTKGKNYIESRIGLKRKIDFYITDKVNLLNYFRSHITDCILVDESQFLSKEHVNQLWNITKILNIPVICYGLRTDFKGNLFEGSSELFSKADEIDELYTICSCGKRAKFNGRFVNNAFMQFGEQVVIDEKSTVKYVPLCGTCFLKYKKRKLK